MFSKAAAVTGLTFGLVNKASGAAITSGTVNAFITKDGGAQAPLAGTPVHEGNGQWSVDLTALEMTADVVGLLFTHVDAIPVQLTIKTITWSSVTVGGVTIAYYVASVADGILTASKIGPDAITSSALATSAVQEIAAAVAAAVGGGDDFTGEEG